MPASPAQPGHTHSGRETITAANRSRDRVLFQIFRLAQRNGGHWWSVVVMSSPSWSCTAPAEWRQPWGRRWSLRSPLSRCCRLPPWTRRCSRWWPAPARPRRHCPWSTRPAAWSRHWRSARSRSRPRPASPWCWWPRAWRSPSSVRSWSQRCPAGWRYPG